MVTQSQKEKKARDRYHQGQLLMKKHGVSLINSLTVRAVLLSCIRLLGCLNKANSCLSQYHWSWWITLLLVIYHSLFTIYYSVTSCKNHTCKYMSAHSDNWLYNTLWNQKNINHKSWFKWGMESKCPGAVSCCLFFFISAQSDEFKCYQLHKSNVNNKIILTVVLASCVGCTFYMAIAVCLCRICLLWYMLLNLSGSFLEMKNVVSLSETDMEVTKSSRKTQLGQSLIFSVTQLFITPFPCFVNSILHFITLPAQQRGAQMIKIWRNVFNKINKSLSYYPLIILERQSRAWVLMLLFSLLC